MDVANAVDRALCLVGGAESGDGEKVGGAL
jgi:hypothetical protein